MGEVPACRASVVDMDVKAAFVTVVVIVRVPPHLPFAMLVVIHTLLSGSGFAGVLLIWFGVVILGLVLVHEGFHHLEHFLLRRVGHGRICANGIRFMWDLDGFNGH